MRTVHSGVGGTPEANLTGTVVYAMVALKKRADAGEGSMFNSELPRAVSHRWRRQPSR